MMNVLYELVFVKQCYLALQVLRKISRELEKTKQNFTFFPQIQKKKKKKE